MPVAQRKKYIARHKQEEWAAKLGTTTFDPLEVLAIQDAIRVKAKTVEIEGRKFILSYKEKGKVFYSPAEDGIFAPCGWLDIDRFLEEWRWEA